MEFGRFTRKDRRGNYPVGLALEDNQGIAHRVIPTAVFTRESSEFHHVDPDLHDPAAHMGAVPARPAEQREWQREPSLGAVHRSLITDGVTAALPASGQIATIGNCMMRPLADKL